MPFAVLLPAELLITMSGNTASEAVACRAGFTIDGTEMRSQRGELIAMVRWTRTVATPR